MRRLHDVLRRASHPALLLSGLAVAALLVALGWLLVEVWPAAEDETWERILATGVLKVCSDPSWPPFELIDERTGAITGLDVELAALLAARLAPGRPLRAEIVPVGFDSLYDALLAGRCDAVISAVPYEAERTEDVAYSLAYFNAGPVIVVREGTAGIESVADLPGRAVGVEWGFVAEGDSHQRLLLRELPVRRYDTAGDALRAVQAGEVEAVLVDHVSALSFVRPCRGLAIVGEPLTEVSYVVPIRPDSPRLLEALDSVLIEMREDGTIAALLERWF